MSSLNEANEKVVQLEHAIWHLESVKKHLHQNASEVKAKIHTNVIQNVEILWNREINLLNQVDEVHRVKEVILQKQMARLNQTLGALQTELSMAAAGIATDSHLADMLEKLKTIELTPEETPYISLKIDQSSLRELILNYGLVNANEPSQMSASNSPGTDFVSVPVPKLSNHLEDWLQKRPLLTKNNSAATIFPARPLPASCPGVVPSTCTADLSNSLHKWLSLKESVECLEEHAFKHSNKGSQKVTYETFSEASANVNADAKQLVDKNLKNWLSHFSGCSPSFSSSFFKHIPTDSTVWLQAYQQLASLSDLKGKDFFQHVSKELSSWLQPSTSSKQIVGHEREEGADFFSHISKDKNYWLLKKNKRDHDCKVDNKADSSCNVESCCKKIRTMEEDGKWLSTQTTNTPVYQLKNICRANELCGNISECVSQPDCYTMWFREKFPVKNVVDPNLAFKPLSLELNEWLSPASQKGSKGVHNEKNTDDLLQHFEDISSSIWIMKPAVSPSLNFKDGKEEINQWLQKTGSTCLPDSSTSSESVRSGSGFSDFTASDWLMVTPEDTKRPQQVIDHEKESEGWSVCSDCHSTTTDQCVKDIAAADEYFSKWLL